MKKLYLVNILLSFVLVGITFSQVEKDNTYIETTTHIDETQVKNEENYPYLKDEMLILKDTTVIIPSREVRLHKDIASHDVIYNRGGLEYRSVKFTLSFYTSLPEENGGHKGITCTGDKLIYGMVASNVYTLGTKIYLEGLGLFTVSDRGGKNFNKSNRLDVFIPRNQGETKAQYKKRVNNMGIKEYTGFIIDN